MKKLTVTGGVPLCGEISVSGSKNAALPILFASLSVRGKSVIKNVPDIGDVRVAIELLRSFGAKVKRNGGTVSVDASSLEYRAPSAERTSKLRASTYLIGACLARFGVCRLTPFGGCNFAPRPIDFHLFAAEALGANIEEGTVSAKKLVGAKIKLPKISVGATVNALIMCASASGESLIYGYAAEPHVMNLIEFLRSGGADIRIEGDYIRVRGCVPESASVSIIGDMIEAGTYAIAAVATGGDVRIMGAEPSELSALNSLLLKGGAAVTEKDGAIRYSGRLTREISVIAAPYPAFPTDLQPPMSVALSLGAGGRIEDRVFPERFGYLYELSCFGIRSRAGYLGAHIYPLSAACVASVKAPDLRGGAACLIAALCAEGESVIASAEKLARGYESLTEKLTSLGARIKAE